MAKNQDQPLVFMGQTALVALAYFAAAKLGLTRATSGGYITLIWLPTGIAVAALWHWGPRMAVGVALGVLASLLSRSNFSIATLPFLLGNTAAPLAVVWLLRRQGFNARFSSRQQVWALVSSAAVGMLLSASWGVLTLWVAGILPLANAPAAWLRWWAGDVTGVLLAGAPLLMLHQRHWRVLNGDLRWGDMALAFCLALASGAYVFLEPLAGKGGDGVMQGALVFVPFVPLAWFAMRSAQAFVPAVAVLLLATLAATGTANGVGVFAAATPTQALATLTGYVLTLELVVLLLAASAAEAKAAGQQLHGLFETTRDAMLLARVDGRIDAVNPAACLLFRANEDELLACPHFALFDETDPRVQAALQERDSSGGMHAVMRALRLDGSAFEAEVHSRRHRLPDGTQQVFVIMRDVSARENAAQTLAASEQRFKLMANAAPVMIWLADAKGERNFFNEVWLRCVGLSAEQQLLQGWQQRVHPDDLASAQTQFALARAAGTTFECQYRVRNAQGHDTVLLERGAPLHSDGVLTGYIGSCVDITVRQQQALALRDSEERLRMALQGGSVGLWEWEPATGGLHLDDNSAQLYGLAKATWLDRTTALACVHAQDRERVAQALGGAIREGLDFKCEYRVVDSTGQGRWLYGAGRPRFDLDGRVVRMSGTLLDVSDRRRTAQALAMAESAQRANEAKSEFVSRMSHELRTPLNAILGFSQLLSEDFGVGDLRRQREQLRHIEQAGWHLLAMIDDVLDLSRIEGGYLDLELEGLPIAQAIGQTLTLVEAAARKRGIRVVVGDISPHAAVRADAVRLRQVLSNLLSNAIKYNRVDGVVELRVVQVADAWRIEVHDRGQGLTAQEQAHLFEPFNRLGKARSGVEGTGIGLVITQRLVQAMEGVMSVHSEPGVGSCFAFTLPAAVSQERAQTSDVKPMGMASQAPNTARRVLYIEDNPLNARIVAEALGKDGLTIHIAETAALGLAKAQQWQPHLILLDLNLPDEPGLVLRQRLLAMPALANIPCAAVTAQATLADREAARAGKFAAYIVKPFDLIELRRQVNTLLPMPEARTLADPA